MTSIPVPFVVALLLAVLAATHHQRLRETATGRLFSTILWLTIGSVILIGLRWTLDRVIFLPFAAVLSVAAVPLVFLAFKSLGRSGPVVALGRDWIHAIPVIVMVLLSFTFTPAIELPLIVTKLIYGGLLIALARQATDTLQLVRLGWFKDSQKSLWACAFFILFSALIDLVIIIDFAVFDGQHAARLVGVMNLIMLVPLGFACVVAGGDSVPAPLPDRVGMIGTVPDTEKAGNSALGSNASAIKSPGVLHGSGNIQDEAAPTHSDPTDPAVDQAILDKLNVLLVEEKLYADTELNLQRLARKAGVPTRSVSRVINAQTGLNMSQWVNNARIDAVCQLLKHSEISVGQAMFEAGFTTKSNFNREFRRVTGSSPSLWRQDQQR